MIFSLSLFLSITPLFLHSQNIQPANALTRIVKLGSNQRLRVVAVPVAAGAAAPVIIQGVKYIPKIITFIVSTIAAVEVGKLYENGKEYIKVLMAGEGKPIGQYFLFSKDDTKPWEVSTAICKAAGGYYIEWYNDQKACMRNLKIAR